MKTVTIIVQNEKKILAGYAYMAILEPCRRFICDMYRRDTNISKDKYF